MTGPVSTAEVMALSVMVSGVELSAREALSCPAVLILTREHLGLEVLLSGPPEDVLDAAHLAVPGLAVDVAAHGCDTWAMSMPEPEPGPDGVIRLPDVDMKDLARNHGGLEAGLVQEAAVVTTSRRDGSPPVMTSRFYARQLGGAVIWTPRFDYRRDTPVEAPGRIPELFTDLFTLPILGEPEDPNRDFLDGLILHTLAESWERVQVAVPRM